MTCARLQITASFRSLVASQTLGDELRRSFSFGAEMCVPPAVLGPQKCSSGGVMGQGEHVAACRWFPAGRNRDKGREGADERILGLLGVTLPDVCPGQHKIHSVNI
jgi:hypothetical protein